MAISRFPLTLLTVFLAGVAIACSLAPPAGASEYEVWSCRGPQGQPLSTAAWTSQTSDALPGDVSATDACASGGPVALRVNDAGVPGDRKARIALSFDLPKGDEIAGYSLNRSIRVAVPISGYDYAAAVRQSDSGTFSDQGCASVLAPPSFNCRNAGSHDNPNGPTNAVNRSGLDLDGLSVWAGCVSSGCTAPGAPPAAEFNLFGSRVAITDDDTPTLTALGGSLARPEPVKGLADLFVDAADTGGGIKSISVSVNRGAPQTITPATATCQEPYEVARPCPRDFGRIFTFDTSTLSEGSHTAEGAIVDAAGNTALFGPVRFNVGRSAPDPDPDPDPDPSDPDNGNPAVTDPDLRLDKELVEHSPGKPGTVTGRLTTTAGTPIVGARLDVVSTTLGGRNPASTQLPAAVTDAAGRFSIPSEGAGARQLTVTFSPVVGGPIARTVSATVRTALSVRFKAKPRRIRLGKSVRFSGTIVGGGPSIRGATAEIQAIADGRWQTVANVNAKANGSFAWKYRFRHVERDAIFSFRALVRSNPGWPWPTVQSKKLKVRIMVPGT